MTEDLSRQLNLLAEKKAREKLQKKEEKIRETILRKIAENINKIKELEKEINDLMGKEQKAISENKKFLTKFYGWQKRRKQSKVEELKKTTPLTKFQ